MPILVSVFVYGCLDSRTFRPFVKYSVSATFVSCSCPERLSIVSSSFRRWFCEHLAATLSATAERRPKSAFTSEYICASSSGGNPEDYTPVLHKYGTTISVHISACISGDISSNGPTELYASPENMAGFAKYGPCYGNHYGGSRRLQSRLTHCRVRRFLPARSWSVWERDLAGHNIRSR